MLYGLSEQRHGRAEKYRIKILKHNFEIGSQQLLLPAMPVKKSDGLGRISTVTRRASNCSDVFFTKRGQASAPGINSFSAAIIWQPLHTPNAKVSGRAKNAANSSRARE